MYVHDAEVWQIRRQLLGMDVNVYLPIGNRPNGDEPF